MRSVILSFALLGALATQPVAAKEPRAHHSAKAEKNSKSETKGGRAGTGGAKAANPTDTQTGDRIDAGVTVLTPRTGHTADKTHNPGISVKVAKPVNLQSRGVTVSEPVKPVVRNAIGQIVTHPQNTSVGGEHIETSVPKPMDFSRPSPHPTTTASTLTSGRSNLIRTSSTPVIGGPSKNASGINGTTVRPRY